MYPILSPFFLYIQSLYASFLIHRILIFLCPLIFIYKYIICIFSVKETGPYNKNKLSVAVYKHVVVMEMMYYAYIQSLISMRATVGKFEEF